MNARIGQLFDSILTATMGLASMSAVVAIAARRLKRPSSTAARQSRRAAETSVGRVPVQQTKRTALCPGDLQLSCPVEKQRKLVRIKGALEEQLRGLAAWHRELGAGAPWDRRTGRWPGPER